jgi:hypothetical protein
MGNIPIYRGSPPNAAATTEETNTGSSATHGTAPSSSDAFVRQSTQLSHQIENRLQAFSAQKNTPVKLQFSNEDLAYLAQAFGSVLKQHPNTNRLKKAQLFAKEVLRRKKLAQLFSDVSEEHFEDICTLIGEQLENSPVFAQMVEDVATEALKVHT